MLKPIEVLLIGGTRPNFIKIAPIYYKFQDVERIHMKLCHTGQHYDNNMSELFWKSFKLPEPDFNLNVKGKNVPDIIGRTIIELKKVLDENNFHLVIVVGDVNATVAGAIAASQSQIKVMHIEAGLRSFDRKMPEEINRIITDHISDFLMVSEQSGLRNLKNEGISSKKIFFVGNIMIESLIKSKNEWMNVTQANKLQNILDNTFILSTFHRPENVDNRYNLGKIGEFLTSLAKNNLIIFPIHPRTSKMIKKFNLGALFNNSNIKIIDPIGYFEFINLVYKCKYVITDSGGIQEETSFLKKPCFTIRQNTERPVTISEGTNRLIDIKCNNIETQISDHLNFLMHKTFRPIKYWDNNVSQRILNVILDYF